MSNDVINTLLKRRSVVARDLISPGPSEDELSLILQAAHRVPDHGKLGPWRFIIFQGESRHEFGETLVEAFLADNPDASEKSVAFERSRLTRAPLVMVVVSSPKEHKVPEWEQVLSCGAVCQNVLTAAVALGYGAQWLTEWYAYSDLVSQRLGLTADEKVAGFIYVGSYSEAPTERNRPDLAERVIHR